jgi:hypothetical protein
MFSTAGAGTLGRCRLRQPENERREEKEGSQRKERERKVEAKKAQKELRGTGEKTKDE